MIKGDILIFSINIYIYIHKRSLIFLVTAGLRNLIMSCDSSKQKEPNFIQCSWELTFPVGPLSVSVHVHLAHLSRQNMEL